MEKSGGHLRVERDGREKTKCPGKQEYGHQKARARLRSTELLGNEAYKKAVLAFLEAQE